MASPLRLLACESTWVRTGYPPTPTPFERVVGIESKKGTIWADNTYSQDPSREYASQHVRDVTINLPLDTAERLVDFFHLEYGPDKGQQRLFNCHRFAAHIAGLQSKPWPMPYSEPTFDQFIKPADLSSGIDAGRIAIIGCRDGRERPGPIHSVIGLGADDDRCIQVMSGEPGHLAIATYSNMLDYWGTSHRDHRGYGLYVSNALCLDDSEPIQ